MAKLENVITQRRICWPNPDATCLMGGCSQCNRHPYRRLKEIENWAKTAPPVTQRARKTRDDPWKVYMQGLANRFYNAETK